VKLREITANSLVGRLIWLAAGWSLAVLAVTCVAATALFYSAAISRFDQNLTDMAEGLMAGSSVDETTGEVVGPALTDARSERAYSGKYWELAEVTSGGGKLQWLVRSRSLWDSELAPPASLRKLVVGSSVHYDAKGPQGEPLHVLASTRTLPGRVAPVVIMVAEDRSPIDRDVRRFAVRTTGLLVLLGIGLVSAVILQVRIGLKPLFDLRREVTDLRKGRAERVQGRYPAELEPLAGELNALVAHNQEVVDRQRTHVGNLAHALKTPLSVMLTEAGRTEGPLAQLVGRQAEAMRLQVDHHLRRARAAARAQGSRDRTLAAPALDELARTLERIFERRGVAIEAEAPEGLAFQGERQDFLEIAGNVMENACKWAKGMVWARAEALSDDRLRLTIEDDGPGLAPDQREEVFKRGARLDESAPGSGLGLSIVEELVRAYGGTISLDQSEHGGLLVRIELPSG
jgi:signal transduction histidine kinase